MVFPVNMLRSETVFPVINSAKTKVFLGSENFKRAVTVSFQIYLKAGHKGS